MDLRTVLILASLEGAPPVTLATRSCRVGMVVNGEWSGVCGACDVRGAGA